MAIACPMPEPAPVTAAMWFCKSPGMRFLPNVAWSKDSTRDGNAA
jgi:hypothetical protein